MEKYYTIIRYLISGDSVNQIAEKERIDMQEIIYYLKFLQIACPVLIVAI